MNLIHINGNHKRQEEPFEGDGYDYCIDCGSFMGIYLSPNSSSCVNMYSFLCINHTSVKKFLIVPWFELILKLEKGSVIYLIDWLEKIETLTSRVPRASNEAVCYGPQDNLKQTHILSRNNFPDANESILDD